MKEKSSSFILLAGGDALVLGLVTVIGFQMHDTLGSGIWRFMATYLPLTVCWFAVGFPMQVFDPDKTSDLRQVWRPFWAMVAASPLALLFRAILLNTMVIPMFVIVFGGLCAVSLLVWRAIYALAAANALGKSRAHG